MRRAVLIRPGGKVEPVMVGDDYRSLQEILGGIFQVIPVNIPNLSFFCCEEPWLLDEDSQQLNELANDICSYRWEPARYAIIGPVLVMGGVDANGTTMGLTPEQADIFLSPKGEAILNALIDR